MSDGNQLADHYEKWSIVLREGTFEERLDTLEEIVGYLDAGRLPLEDSLQCYEMAVLVARECEKMLDDAELRISRLDSSVREEEVEDYTLESTN